MVGRFVIAVALSAFALNLPFELGAQERPRILIPYFVPAEGVSDRFGKETAKELQEIINRNHPIYEAIPEDEIKDELDRFDMKIEELTCLQTRQLAGQINASLAVCVDYTEEPGKRYNFAAQIWDVTTGESLEITPLTVEERDYDGAARHILAEFDTYVELIRSRDICIEYQQSQQWENALRQCDNALRINPTANATRYRRARILMEMERGAEALEELRVVLEADPIHEDALQSAGYLATQLAETPEDRLEARGFYQRYLDLNPANAQIRMNIAYELARAGDPVGAMELIQVGLDLDAENVALWEQYGNFAFAGAEQADTRTDGADELSDEISGYYREAIDAYTRVYEIKGAETNVRQLRNVMAAHLQLDEVDAALALGEQATRSHASEEAIWSIYSTALAEVERFEAALGALNELETLNPDFANLALRQADLLVKLDRMDDAVQTLSRAVSAGRVDADGAGNILYNDGVLNGYRENNWRYAIGRFEAAKNITGVSGEFRGKVDFLHGVALYQLAVVQQGPNTLATAQATKPLFERVLGLMDGAAAYAAANNQSSGLSEIRAGAAQYIDIQNAIIRRGGGL